MLLILAPVILITAIVIGVKYHCNTRRQMWIYLACVFCVVCMVFNLFVWNMAPAYSAHSLDQKLNLERKPVSAEELAHTADILLEELKKLEDEILFMAPICWARSPLQLTPTWRWCPSFSLRS